MKDDDQLPSTQLVNPLDDADMNTVYRSSYVEFNNLGDLVTPTSPFDTNVGDDDPNDYAQASVCNGSVARENAAYWCVHAIACFQGLLYRDLERVREFYSAFGNIRCRMMVKFANISHVSEDNVEYS
jgi:hypothetical protein